MELIVGKSWGTVLAPRQKQHKRFDAIARAKGHTAFVCGRVLVAIRRDYVGCTDAGQFGDEAKAEGWRRQTC